MSGRDQILGRVRAAVRRDHGGKGGGGESDVAARLRGHPRNLVPARGQLDPVACRELFVDMAR